MWRRTHRRSAYDPDNDLVGTGRAGRGGPADDRHLPFSDAGRSTGGRRTHCHAGGTLILQLLAVAVVGAGAVVAWYFARKGRPTEPPAEANRDVIMDIGETVQVEAWNPDGTATTRYRGAQWTVFHRPGETPQPGAHRVAEVIGSRLLVDHI